MRVEGRWVGSNKLVELKKKKKNPLSNAEDSGLILGQGTKIPHAKEQLSPHTPIKTQHSQTKSKAKKEQVE